MKNCLLLFYILFSFNARAQLTDARIHDLKSGKVKQDTSYIYQLPFAGGSRYFLIQAYNSKMSHTHELSLDFKMKPGRKICAAREGIVESIKEDSDVGGLKNEYMNQGNHVIIRHSDGSMAMYWHLKKDGVLVSAGDSVTKGQHIGYSGNTGYSAFPHFAFPGAGCRGKRYCHQVQYKKGCEIFKACKMV